MGSQRLDRACSTFPTSLRPRGAKKRQEELEGRTIEVYEPDLIAKQGTFHLESGAEYGETEKKDGKVVNGSLFMNWQTEVPLFDVGECIDSCKYEKVSVNSWRALIALL